ncbi:MAG: glutamate--tRNA ligase [Rhodospirillales bacterium]|nr:glutamate--tRNA ligase [Alphaproteobacteria bacterium]MCB9976545.1 glutamate--tRNA ligase [Rhodospirillales bacterium]
MTVRVRFAPSPTGMLHIGNARTALITWLYARAKSGHFLLRIDDTDLERSKKEYEDAIEDGLKWLGMNWDEKARQRDRMDHYNVKIDQLKASGRLYPCYETPEELELKRKSQLARKLPPLYDREALKLTDEQKKAFEAQGRKPHWRFKINHTPIKWDDEVRGPVHFEGSDMSDPVLIREDGSPLYHLCSVIDDIDYQMTHVVRGEDHVTNTAMHVQMFEALGAKPPSFAHLPLLSDAQGGKLSKRLGALNLKELRDQEGLEAMAVVSLLSRLGTSDPIEPFTDIKEVIAHFDIAKFGRGTPKFDQEELTRLNAKILHITPYAAIKARLEEIGLSELDEKFWLTVRPNLEKLDDAKEWWRVANGPVEPVIEDAAFIAEAAKLLPETPWTRDTWGVWVDAVKVQTGRKGKQLFMPLRKALTGMEHGPELADLLLLIGPEKTRKRLGT